MCTCVRTHTHAELWHSLNASGQPHSNIITNILGAYPCLVLPSTQLTVLTQHSSSFRWHCAVLFLFIRYFSPHSTLPHVTYTWNNFDIHTRSIPPIYYYILHRTWFINCIVVDIRYDKNHFQHLSYALIFILLLLFTWSERRREGRGGAHDDTRYDMIQRTHRTVHRRSKGAGNVL